MAKERVLSAEQRKQYNQILKNKGQGAAKQFRDGIIVEQGGTPKASPKADKPKSGMTNKNLKKIQDKPLQGIRLGEKLAEKEFQTNLETNRPNQETIGGGREYVTNPDGSVTVVDKLDQGQQQLYDQDLAQRGAANEMFMNAFMGQQFGQGYDLSGLPQAPMQQDLASERARIEDTIFDRDAQLINRQADRERERMEQQLYMRGNVPGTPAYEQAMQQFNEGVSSEMERARANAVQTGGAEFERNFNIGTQGRQNALSEMVFGRTQPLSELQALSQFGGGPTMLPNFFGFQPISYQGPQLPQYLGLGLEAELGRGQLDVSRTAANRSGGGGGYAGPQFSIGGYPDSGLPPASNAPNPAAANFAQGLQGGATMGFTR